MAEGAIRKGLAALIAGGAMLPAMAALSQQVTPDSPATQAKPPPRLVFSLKTGVNTDTNRALDLGPKDPATTLDTNLGLSYSARTRVQSLDASVEGLWRLGKAGRGSGSVTGTTGLQEPVAKLAYSFDNGASAISVNGYYRKSPVNLYEPLTLSDGTLSPTDLTAVTGSVISWGARASLETGKEATVGVIASASTDRRNYLDNTSPGIYDSRTDAASAGLRFHLDPTSQLDASFGFTRQTYQNTLQTSSTQRQVSLAYTRALSPALTLQSQLGYSRDRTDQLFFGLPVRQSAAGLFGSVGLTQKLAAGSASVTLASARDSFGVRNSLEVGRSFLLPTVRFDALAGVSVRPGYGPQAIGQLSYTAQGERDSLTASLARSVALDANNNDVAYTTVALDYRHKLTPITGLGLSLTASRSGSGGLGVTQSVDRQSLSATYSYQVTPDWSLDAGYLFRHLKEAGTGSATSNSVFVTLGRKFTLLP